MQVNNKKRDEIGAEDLVSEYHNVMGSSFVIIL